MKKLFISIVGVMMAFSSSWAQEEEIQYTKLEDLTSKLVNADFSADTPVDAVIKTYAKDLTDEGAGAGGVQLFGQQAVTGWTAVNLTDNIMTTDENTGLNARAAGVMTYWTEDESEAPYGLGAEGNIPHVADGGSTRGLGVLAVWGAKIQYTQEITLPAGAYLIEVPVYNTFGAGGMTNYNGFIAADGKEYLSKNNAFSVNAFGFTTDVITFLLDEETTGVISLGYLAGGIGSADAPHLYYNNIKLYKIDAKPLEDARIASAKEKLEKAISDGEQVGASTTDAVAVYDNPNATYAEVLAAVDAQNELNKAAQTDLSEFFIENPHFNQDDALPEGDGITTYDYDRSKNSVNYYGMQPVKGWIASHPAATIEENPLDKNTGVNNGRACGVVAVGSGVWLGGSQFTVPTEMSDGSKEGNLLGFLTCWSATTQYTQSVTIPAGKYTLKISYYNQAGTNNVQRNLMGFIADDGTEYLSDILSFKTGSWETMTIMFTLDEPTSGKFSVGYTAANTGSGNMPHFFIDGISLNYVGETALDPSLFALQAAVTSGKQILDDNKFESSLTEEFRTAVEAGQELVSAASADGDANLAAKDAITALLADVNASIKAYKDLVDFTDNTLNDAIEKYEEDGLFSELHESLENLAEECYGAAEDYSWSTEKIKEVMASLPGMIKEATQKAYEVVQAGDYKGDGVDITSLLSGLAYTYDVNAQSGANVPDKEWNYGDATGFKTQYGTAEVWNKSPFKVYNTIADMPAGTYTIKTRAFYRTTANDANYTEYTETENPIDRAFVFAGHLKTPLTNVAAFASDNEKFSAVISEGVRVPNTQNEAYTIFNDKAYDEYLVKEVKTVLAQKGDLTFGVCADEMSENSWVVWYSFEIVYNKLEDEVLAEELAGLVVDAKNLLEDGSVVNSGIFTALENAINAAEEASEGNLVDADIALEAAMKNYEECAAAYAKLAEEVEALGTAIADYADKTDPAIAEKANELYAELDNGISGQTLTTEEAKAALANINRIIGELRIPSGMDAATDEAPVECTQMITNPSFESGDLTGWTVNPAATGDTGAKENSHATYTMEGCDGTYVFNTWNGSAVDFYAAQTISVLMPGTYEISCVVASDKGNVITLSVNGAGIDTVMEYEKDQATPVSLVFAVAEGESAEIKVSSASWFKADNFVLNYFGQNSEKELTAVEAVEAASEVAAIYSATGVRQSGLQKGLNIVKMQNNTVKKIFVK